ncbi:MAG: hypothetical protein H0X42_03385 [Solirubrobacterales bacterium]|nr:hypothetical protein [Solirubrobacterales bacterium]
MRLLNRRHQRGKRPRIVISAEEIAADLHYPAGRPPARRASAPARQAGSR